MLTVCYGHPADPATFDAYYASTHVPLAADVPNFASGGVAMFVAHD